MHQVHDKEYELRHIQASIEKVMSELYYLQLTYDTVADIDVPKSWTTFYEKSSKYLLKMHKQVSTQLNK